MPLFIYLNESDKSFKLSRRLPKIAFDNLSFCFITHLSSFLFKVTVTSFVTVVEQMCIRDSLLVLH